MAPIKPVCATAYPKRRYNIAPKIVEIAVIKTGAVPKFAFCFNRVLDIIMQVRCVQINYQPSNICRLNKLKKSC